MNKKLRYMLYMAVGLLVLLLIPTLLYPESIRESPHGDKTKLLKGCGSCHKGHGVLNSPMLPDTMDVFCYRCHGSISIVQQTRLDGDLAQDTKAADLERVFDKPYRHPIDKIGIHSYGEILPETDPSAQRHSECVDCHHYHYVQTGNKFAGIKGVNSLGLVVDTISYEYELCFKCHSRSANLPPDERNKITEFAVSNPSYHPVISQGKNVNMPSLTYPLTKNSTIKCSDCHNSDDASGPKGPHGSIYKSILKKQYVLTDGPEGPSQYDLCYSCHRRESILGNESFPYHNTMISTVGASCRTCHNPHGSTRYAHLIDLDNLSISPSSSGRLDYISLGFRAGECYLTCHGRDHNPATYPQTGSPSPSQPARSTKVRK